MQDISNIANKVAEHLKDYGAEVMYAPNFELYAMQGKKVIVLPYGKKRKITSRIAYTNDCVLHIAVIKKCRNEAEVPELVSEVEEIGNKILKSKVDSSICVSIEYEPLYSSDDLRTNKLFIGVIQADFREIE